MTFNAAAVTALFAAVVSQAKQLGVFQAVIAHEPKNAPGNGLSCAVWVQSITPVRSSGLAAVSGRVSMRARVYSNMLQEPQDGIDPAILAAACQLLEAFSEGFTLDGTVREVDLLGAEGEVLAAEAGYITIGQAMFRAMELTIPVVINDLWLEAP